MLKMPDAITAMEDFDYKSHGIKGVILALKNMQIRLYKDKHLVNLLQVDVRLKTGWVESG